MLFVVKGNPIPLKRPRLCKGRLFNSQEKEMNSFAWDVKSQMKLYEIGTYGPVKLTIGFYMPIPKSLSKKKKALLLASSHIKKPDLSNLIKFVEDSLNGILWNDDSIIHNIRAKKIYSNDPRTVISVVKG